MHDHGEYDFSFANLIAYVTTFMTIKPGDHRDGHR